jgi:spore coat polysaccharide biosynthesis protein SpsF
LKIVGSIEARMGSSRLPGKTLTPLFQEKPLLAWVVHRFKKARSLDGVVVATTTSPKDDPIASWCAAAGVPCSRGSEEDVLDRVATAARSQGADAIVQMGADSAYLDFEMVDRLVALYKTGRYDYVCNDLKLTFPLGIYAHVVSVPVLAALNARADLTAEDREDVVRPIFEHPDRYRVTNLEAAGAERRPDLRFTIDYAEDLELARAVYAKFGGGDFTSAQLLALAAAEPALFEKTRGLVQRSAPHLKPKA